ncbi:MAG: regulatory iron-sulfur-containing complex subunit RicT [Bacteroidales bacterium]|nr:regulatory iron-sulfur-containing complex subunit RicT [Bacteroidales bacterium]
MEYKLNICGSCMKKNGCSGLKIKKLNTFDWLCDLPQAQKMTDWVEVQFKNTRKGYYLNSNKIELEKGDLVAVESSPGHDIGEVTLTGALVLKQMKKSNYRFDQQEVRRVYRKARPVDLEKYEEAKAREHDTMLKSRKIAEDLKLNMKIGDVEYQGDGNKAIFYYIADDRVDFRQLIKVLAEAFHVRIEMKQIGARQEAGRIGGVGPCGRELCCSSWMTNFVSVSTSTARYQDLSLNPQKLAGQCAKLKCCLNYETDVYAEAQKDIPSKDIILETKECNYYLFKADIFKRQLTYSTSKEFLANAITIPVERAKQIIALNKRGARVENLSEVIEVEQKREFGDVLSQDGLTRFDRAKKTGKSRNRHRPERPEKTNDLQKQEHSDKPERIEKQDRMVRPERKEKPGQAQVKKPETLIQAEEQKVVRDEANHQSNPNAGHKKNMKNKNRNKNQQNRPHFDKPQKPTSSNNDTPKNEA